MKYFLLIISIFSTTGIWAQSKINWNTAADISVNNNGNMHPRMCLDGKGNPLVIWGRMDDEGLMFSRWSGTSFTTPVKLNPSWMPIATASWMGPDIASKGDTVYIVMRQTPEADDTSKHIYIITSFNGGMSFLEPVRVEYLGGDSTMRFPTVTVDETGNPVVAFMKFNSMFQKSVWVVTRSNDYGKTFRKDVKAGGFSSAETEACDCCPGAIICSGNTTAMLYRDNLKNIRDIWAGISTDNQKSFNTGFNIDNNKWMIMSCPSSGPDGFIIGDTLYSVFLNGGSGKYRTYLSRASISNTTVSSVTKLTSEITGLGQQNYPRMATNGKAAAIVWRQNISGTAQLPILFTNNITGGFPSNYEIVDLADVTNADVAVSNQNIFVVWEDDKSGTIKYRIGNYTGATSISETEINTFTVYPNPASGSLFIRTNFEIKNADIKIINVLGETVAYKLHQKNALMQIDISGLKDGIYFVQVNTGTKSIIQKFIKE